MKIGLFIFCAMFAIFCKYYLFTLVANYTIRYLTIIIIRRTQKLNLRKRLSAVGLQCIVFGNTSVGDISHKPGMAYTSYCKALPRYSGHIAFPHNDGAETSWSIDEHDLNSSTSCGYTSTTLVLNFDERWAS